MSIRARERTAVWTILLLLAAAPISRGAGEEEGKVEQPTPAPGLGGLAWLAGAWGGETDGVRAEEYWTTPRGGMMLGLHRDVFEDGSAFFEYLRIERTAAGIVYLASPRGAKATPFRLVELKGRRAVFENPQHDFPQRIVYWMEDDATLCARIEGRRNGDTASSKWCWMREGI